MVLRAEQFALERERPPHFRRAPDSAPSAWHGNLLGHRRFVGLSSVRIFAFARGGRDAGRDVILANRRKLTA